MFRGGTAFARLLRWRLRTLLVAILIATLPMCAYRLRVRSHHYQSLAAMHHEMEVRFVDASVQADRRSAWYGGFADDIRAGRGGGIYSATADDEELRNNLDYLRQASSWWGASAEDDRKQAAFHARLSRLFSRAAWRPWESASRVGRAEEMESNWRLAADHAEREFDAGRYVDGNKSEEINQRHLSMKPPPIQGPDRRAEFARCAQAYARQAAEAAVEASWHSAMRRKYLRELAHLWPGMDKEWQGQRAPRTP
jgi:hypothetical protein